MSMAKKEVLRLVDENYKALVKSAQLSNSAPLTTINKSKVKLMKQAIKLTQFMIAELSYNELIK